MLRIEWQRPFLPFLCYTSPMSDLTNPHDKFFKETFTRIEVARNFFANYLPQSVVDTLDLDTLTLQSGSFIDTELQEQFADLLYQVDLQDASSAYLYLLLEHKSHPDPHTLFQLLRYLVRIWERDIQDGNPLRPIVPIVVYHGRERWRVPTEFGELFTGPEALLPYWPQFRYELQDLSALSDEEVRGTVHLQIGLLVLKYIFDPALQGRLADIFLLFKELAEAKSALEYLHTVLYYMGNASKHLTAEDMVTIVQQTLADEGNEIMQTVADYWRAQGIERGFERGIEQGIERGIERGVEQGRVQMLQEGILDLLEIRFDLAGTEITARITAVSDPAILRQLLRQAATTETADAFLQHLPS
ncbi:MAG: Rpn family recombination-promoting nuclease/putative transposase [Aquificales bacterium]|nr:Rpn family recombination-promoting nuclease/putative transposase [Aquificales bacterium]